MGGYSHIDLLKKCAVQIHVFNSYLLAYRRNTVAQLEPGSGWDWEQNHKGKQRSVSDLSLDWESLCPYREEVCHV